MKPRTRQPDQRTSALFPPDSDWRPPGDFPDFSEAKVLGVDTETRDDYLKADGPGFIRGKANLVGVSVCPEGGEPIYVPLHHPEDNCDYEPAMRWLKDTLGGPATKVGANILYDVEALDSEGLPLGGPWRDVQVIEALLDEEREGGYSLASLAGSYLGESKNQRLLEDAASAYHTDPRGGLWALPARYVGPYAQDDSRLPLGILRLQDTRIREEGLNTILGIEEKITKLCWEMRRRGVRVDLERLEHVDRLLARRELELFREIRECWGQLDPWSVKSLTAYCQHNRIELPHVLTEKSGEPSFTSDWFKSNPRDDIKRIGEFRSVNKTRRDFIQKGIKRYLVGDRVHAQWHQLRREEGGTRSGRFASSHPNHQQWPGRDEQIGPLIRGLFVPEEGELWYKGDYASQEPRLAVHYAAHMQESVGFSRFHGASAMVEEFENNPRFDLHAKTADIMDCPRRHAKSINLGIMYGMGTAKLGRELGISADAARDLYQSHKGLVPFLHDLSRAVQKRAEEKGFISTYLGRHQHFPKNSAFIYKALNRLIQGSAADMTKKAMIDIWEEYGLVPLLSVHDELDYSIPDRELAGRVTRSMEQAVTLRVPIVVDEFVANNWGECK